jgi:hypothetical protein
MSTPRCVQIAIERNEFPTMEDGYVVWWPDFCGSIRASELRALADELDRRNAEWDAIVRAEVGPLDTRAAD